MNPKHSTTLEPAADNGFDDAFVSEPPTDEELEEMFQAIEEDGEMAAADASDWREDIWREHIATETRAIRRSLERYR